MLLLCKHFTLKTSVKKDTIKVLETLLIFVQEIALNKTDDTLIKTLKNSGPTEINAIVQMIQKEYDDMISKEQLGIVKNEQLFRI